MCVRRWFAASGLNALVCVPHTDHVHGMPVCMACLCAGLCAHLHRTYTSGQAWPQSFMPASILCACLCLHAGLTPCMTRKGSLVGTWSRAERRASTQQLWPLVGEAK